MKAPPRLALHAAIEAAMRSSCQSRRGAAIFLTKEERVWLLSVGFNQKPPGFAHQCDTSDACKASCRREAVHAEQVALLALLGALTPAGADMLHIKVVNGLPVASGPPSCVECSKLILGARLAAVWLLEADGWQRYPSEEFHSLSLQHRRRQD